MKFPASCLFALALTASLAGQTLVVKPYVQPGDGSALGSSDTKVVAWMTDNAPGDFTVEYRAPGGDLMVAQPRRTPLQIPDQAGYLLYAATLEGLPLNADVQYRVKLGQQVVGENSFPTRRTADQPLHFAVVGDMADNSPGQRAIAFQMAQAKPQFALACGDIVYNRGRFSQYLDHFWPDYVSPVRDDPAVGSAIMQSVPFYMVLGNHDVEQADLARIPDAFAAFYFFHVPRNAPAGPWTTPIRGPDDRVRKFKATAESAGYPWLSLYSFDNGPAHFLVLDSDSYAPVQDPAFVQWIRNDLNQSHAAWKFVFFHHPGFTAAAKHGNEQKMRLLSPVFEKAGVDVVFAGHVHNYQRSKPLRFAPAEPNAEKTNQPIRGTFQIDNGFDGATRTEADGIVYVVTGGGGAGLYAMTDPKTGKTLDDPDAPQGFVARWFSDRHSFSVVDLTRDTFTLRQLDLTGAEVDRFQITKRATHRGNPAAAGHRE